MIEQAPVKCGEGHLLVCARGGLEKDSGHVSSGGLAVGWRKSSGGHSCRTRNGSSLRRKGLGEVRVGVIALEGPICPPGAPPQRRLHQLKGLLSL